MNWSLLRHAHCFHHRSFVRGCLLVNKPVWTLGRRMMVSIVGMSPGRSTTEDPDIVVDHVKKWEREAQGSCKSFISEIPAERKKNHQQRSTSIHLAAESRLSSILQKSYGLNKNNKNGNLPDSIIQTGQSCPPMYATAIRRRSVLCTT